MKTTYPKLPKKFKEKWLKALRSGEYEQGGIKLYTQQYNSYCCLGVACDIVGHKKTMIDNADPVIINERYKNIPKSIKGSAPHNALVLHLTSMNDGSGSYRRNAQSFKQIANWIEHNL